MGLIKTADIKTKYSSHFDIILPWFPIYLKKICRDRNFDDIYILKYVKIQIIMKLFIIKCLVNGDSQ